MNSADDRILRAQSHAADPEQAIKDIHSALDRPNTAQVILFFSNSYNIDRIQASIAAHFAGVPVIGCTTAGEFGPEGYWVDSVVGISLPASQFQVVSRSLRDLTHFELGEGYELTQNLLRELEAQAPQAQPNNIFAYVLIDGLSMQEELVAHTLQSALGDIPLFGGSAGDGLDFRQTYVLHNGEVMPHGAVLLLATTPLPFTAFKSQHFCPSDIRMVVTDADPAKRLVREINGLPAATEYARLTGLSTDALDPDRFASSPVEVQIDGTDYVRSIQKANPDGSLTFFCAIEEGLVLRVAQGLDLLENLQNSLDQLRTDLGPIQFILGSDCVLRGLEIRQSGLEQAAWEQLNTCHAAGFNTYGEQYQGVHVNQTLTGIAFGMPADEADD